jgi:peptidoglycan/xylan/chitin deacetylase (PgdA/CDA1 family)
MYHRVASPSVDPWGLAVHPDRFAAQLDVLRRRRTPMTVSGMVDRLDQGRLPDDAVAVSFDDGYADNLFAARPRLAAAGVPATLFLTAGAIGQPREFWWDELARAILARPSALECEVMVSGRPCRIAFAASPSNGDHEPAWRAWEEPRTERQRAFIDLWSRLRVASAAERDAAMLTFRNLSRTPLSSTADLPLTVNEVEDIARDGLFEIGGHTLTHPVLPLLEPGGRRREIADGKKRCEEITRHPITGFAYPHGAMDADSRAAVRDSGFSWACTTAAGFVTSSCDRFALPRLFVQDWDAAAFERALS